MIANITNHPLADGGNDWSLIVFPDIQNYTDCDEYTAILEHAVNWVIYNKKNENIKLVLQVGDITNNNNDIQWKRAHKAFSKLNGVLPYILASGNHDIGSQRVGGDRSSKYNCYFKHNENPLNHFNYVSFFHGRDLENTGSVLNFAGTDWLIINLEFGPRTQVVAWADSLLRRYRKMPTILLTHELFDHLSNLTLGEPSYSNIHTPNNPYCYGVSSDRGGVHCGEELWENLLSQHSQIKFTFSGHYRAYERNIDGFIRESNSVADLLKVNYRKDGTKLRQYLFNSQWGPRGGDGLIKLLKLNNTGKVLHDETINTTLNPIRFNISHDPFSW